tara:strand:- start:138 stop:395 length:258 start_codon:yes stop_codon:yes gene_type:complete
MKKNLIHFFAVIGFGTFILLACSVDDIADSMNNSQITSTTGKYQVEVMGGGYDILVLNTETGQMKRYAADDGWTELTLFATTFTH